MKLNQDSGELAMSPDATQVAMDSSTGGFVNVWLMDLASGKLKQLTFDKDMAAFPAWSPDGKFIAVEIQKGAENSVGVLSSAGGPITELTPYQGQHWLHGWSPDGRSRIICSSRGRTGSGISGPFRVRQESKSNSPTTQNRMPMLVIQPCLRAATRSYTNTPKRSAISGCLSLSNPYQKIAGRKHLRKTG